MAVAPEPTPSFDLDRLAQVAKRLLAGESPEDVARDTGIPLRELHGLREQLIGIGIARSTADPTRLERAPTFLAWLGRVLGYRK